MVACPVLTWWNISLVIFCYGDTFIFYQNDFYMFFFYSYTRDALISSKHTLAMISYNNFIRTFAFCSSKMRVQISPFNYVNEPCSVACDVAVSFSGETVRSILQDYLATHYSIRLAQLDAFFSLSLNRIRALIFFDLECIFLCKMIFQYIIFL